MAEYDPFTEATLEECLAYHDAVTFPGIDQTAQLMLALSRVHLLLHKGSRDEALQQLQETAVEFVDILGVASQTDSYEPTPGSPETMLPRFRMDRTITEVLSGAGTDGPRRAGRTPPSGAEPRTELDRARAALSRRDWDEARQILEPLIAADPHGPGAFLLARIEFESGHPVVAAAMLDDFLARHPRHLQARALRARVHLAARNHAEARAEAEEALRIDPGLVTAHRVLFDLAVAERLRAQASRRTATT